MFTDDNDDILWGRVVVALLIALFLLIYVPLDWMSGRVTGSGEKVGTIIHVTDQGWLNRTHEFEIIRGGMSNGSGGFSVAPACITVADEGQLAQVQRFFDTQQEVRVRYIQKGFSPWSSEGDCGGSGYKFLTHIEAAKP